jgi:signal transduction histidine kinase
MRERVKELGGAIEIRTDDPGTTVAVSLPLDGNIP